MAAEIGTDVSTESEVHEEAGTRDTVRGGLPRRRRKRHKRKLLLLN